MDISRWNIRSGFICFLSRRLVVEFLWSLWFGGMWTRHDRFGVQSVELEAVARQDLGGSPKQVRR